MALVRADKKAETPGLIKKVGDTALSHFYSGFGEDKRLRDFVTHPDIIINIRLKQFLNKPIPKKTTHREFVCHAANIAEVRKYIPKEKVSDEELLQQKSSRVELHTKSPVDLVAIDTGYFN